MTESEREAQARKVWKREQPVCVCKPANPRHKDGYHCLSPEQFAAWKERNPQTLASEKTQRALAWLWLQYSQDPDARRLSGRVVTLEESDRLHALADGFGWDEATGTEWWQREM